MADEGLGERTEPATPRKREEARRRGQVARSADLSSSAVLLAAVAGLEIFGRGLATGLAESVSGVLGHLDAFQGGEIPRLGGAVLPVALAFLPFALLLVAAALAANLGQVGFLWAGGTLAPDLARLDPLAGARRVFSLRSLARLLGGLLKVAAVAGVALLTIWAERGRLPELATRPLEGMLGLGGEAVSALALRTALVLLLLALLDYGFQRWQHERELRMSRAELREEIRRYEGDPVIKERRRAVQRQIALGRMVEGVARATVVLTNPTDLAVAVEFDPGRMAAPVVLAKGRRLLAERIHEAARAHGVPVVERTELARALYKAVGVGGEVPPEHYRAVADVLAWVFRLKNPVVTS
jgi:flagellar biosynthetic protein FlhB